MAFSDPLGNAAFHFLGRDGGKIRQLFRRVLLRKGGVMARPPSSGRVWLSDFSPGTLKMTAKIRWIKTPKKRKFAEHSSGLNTAPEGDERSASPQRGAPSKARRRQCNRQM